MDIKILDKKTDLEKLGPWFPFKKEELPGHIFGALFDGEIIAIAGLRLMEGTFCLLDSMCSNQEVLGEVRDQALDELTETIFTKARELGFKAIIATTDNPSILVRAQKLGFKASPQIVMAKEL